MQGLGVAATQKYYVIIFLVFKARPLIQTNNIRVNPGHVSGPYLDFFVLKSIQGPFLLL